MTETYTPGIQGQARISWRDPTHLRGLLIKIITLYPDADRDALEPLYVAAAKGDDFHASELHEAFIDEALRYKFANDYNAWLREYADRRPKRRPPTPIPQSEVDAVTARLEAMILLDLVMPNGKLLRHCTGDECSGFSGWFAKIRDRVGSNIVGEVLGEQDLVSLRDAA